jgi:hypothetical protein
MEYPKKFIKSYEDEKPDKIVRGSGEPGCCKTIEYRLVREIGKTGVYKQ